MVRLKEAASEKSIALIIAIDFNSTMVRLKVGKNSKKEFSENISIPLWFD